MKLVIDTQVDSPRLMRAAIAFMLEALGNGTAIPMHAGHTGVVMSESERLETDAREEDTARATFAGNSPEVSANAAGVGFGSSPLPPGAQAAPSTAAVAASPTAPAQSPGALPSFPFATQAPALSLVPPASAPSAPAAPTPPASGVEVDKRGLPWDERINQKGRNKDAGGNWKYTKGIDRVALVPAVEAQLRGLMGLPAPLPPAAPPVLAPPVAQQAPAAAATHAPASPSAPSGVVPDFGGLMSYASNLIAAGRLTSDQLKAACNTFGVAEPFLLSGRPDLIPSVIATVNAMLVPA